MIFDNTYLINSWLRSSAVKISSLRPEASSRLLKAVDNKPFEKF